MYRAAAYYHRCPGCNQGFRRRHFLDHIRGNHPAIFTALTTQPVPALAGRWARFMAWLRTLGARLVGAS